jgi:hypothetical protein
MSFSPKPCAHCGNVHFHVLPGVQVEAGLATTVLGMSAYQKILGARLSLTLVACTQCGRTEVFTANAAELAQKVPGSHVAQSA